MNCIICRIALLAVLIATMLVALPDDAHADLLIDPTGGTDIFTPISKSFDDEIAVRSIGGTFDAGGAIVKEVSVSVDGYIQSKKFVADVLEDDFVLKGGGTQFIRESITPDYYAVTWNVRGYTHKGDAPPGLSQFQVTLFKNAATVQGTMYQSGDIVFSYGILNHTVDTGSFDVSVYDQKENKTSPFRADGSHATTAEFLVNFDSTKQAILFRNTEGMYIQSLVPMVHPPVVPPSPPST